MIISIFDFNCRHIDFKWFGLDYDVSENNVIIQNKLQDPQLVSQ